MIVSARLLPWRSRGTGPLTGQRPAANDDGGDDARRQSDFERICARELLGDSD